MGIEARMRERTDDPRGRNRTRDRSVRRSGSPASASHHGRYGFHALMAGRVLRRPIVSPGGPIRQPRHRPLDDAETGRQPIRSDMADDVMRVVDAYGFPVAHLVSISLGGMIAQWAALK